ncbi:unnamed protein product [Camellia sinensis]
MIPHFRIIHRIQRIVFQTDKAKMGTVTGPWKQLLLNALDSNSALKHSSFFQLATIGSNGRPSNRTVVFRGFEENSDKMRINTDCRTHKIDDLKHCPFAEICWYFTDSWEQFRINGRIDVVDGLCLDPLKLQVQREKAWFASSVKSRLQYLGPNPGLPSLGEQSSSESSLDPSAGPVDAFCLLVLDPDQVDYLNLKINERLTFSSRQNLNGEKFWSSERINPLVTFYRCFIHGHCHSRPPQPPASPSPPEWPTTTAAAICGGCLQGMSQEPCCLRGRPRCGEFMPSPTSISTDPTSLKCAVCGCHCNFHRREPEDLPPPSTAQHVIEYQPQHRHHPPMLPRSLNSASPPPISSAYYPSAPHMLLALSAGLSGQVPAENRPVNSSGTGNPNGQKRHRTKFTQDQKERMLEFVERVGWKTQKKDDEVIAECCSNVGVGKGVFKELERERKREKQLEGQFGLLTWRHLTKK